MGGCLNKIAGSKLIYFIGATNEYGNLDDSITSKMEHKLKVGLPDENTRFRIFKFNVDKMEGLKSNLTDIDLKELELLTKSFSVRDIGIIFHKATAEAKRNNQEEILPCNIKAALNIMYIEIMETTKESSSAHRKKFESDQKKTILLNKRDSELSSIDRKANRINSMFHNGSILAGREYSIASITAIVSSMIYDLYALYGQKKINDNYENQRQELDKNDWIKIFDILCCPIEVAKKWLSPELVVEIYGKI